MQSFLRAAVTAFLALGLVQSQAILVAGVWFVWNADRPPVALDQLARLRPGMTQDQVRDLLGAPNRTETSPVQISRGDPPASGSECWTYSQPLSWAIVRVRFDEAGRFVASDYDPWFAIPRWPKPPRRRLRRRENRRGLPGERPVSVRTAG